MAFIEGIDRMQMKYVALDDMVAADSMARVIDLFITKMDLAKLGFSRTKGSKIGRPGYAAEPLIKLYVYGYNNSIRSSRKLEKEAARNVEVMWLTDGLRPDYKTIAEFRRLNIRPLQKLFREFVKLCRSWDLVGGKVFATDGSKFRASNNKKMNYSRKKLERRLREIDEKTAEYLAAMDEEDKREDGSSKAPDGLLELMKRKELYEKYLKQLDESGENEISAVDPDARLMGNNRGGVEMSYNVQSTVDSDNHIVVAYDVTKNPSDQGCLETTSKKLLRMKFGKFKLLADKGFYRGKDLRKMRKYGLTAIVARQKPPNPKDQPAEFHTDKFIYDPVSDTYTCPTGEVLYMTSNGKDGRKKYSNKNACVNCPYLTQCASGSAKYRSVTRGPYANDYEWADRLFDENRELYAQRQQLVEHPFGTVKRTLHGGYFLLRTRRKVRCEVALLFLAYNMKRAYTVLGFKELMMKLASLRDRLRAFLIAFPSAFFTRFLPPQRLFL